jgi:hypothetical protein
MKKNTGLQTGKNVFIPPPVKQYRREIDTEDNCSRATISLADFFRPGATIVNSASGAGVHTVDFNLVNDATEKPSTQTCAQSCARAENAKRRLRSAGAPKQNYYTSTAQYLQNRNIGNSQNNYQYLRIGEPTFRNGIPATVQNVYTPTGINKKSKMFISGCDTETNPLFKYRWINGNIYSVKAPDGEYDLEDLNILFHATQENNKHYLIDTYANNSKVHFMKFVYDVATDRIQIQITGISLDAFESDRYFKWTSYLITVDWEIPQQPAFPNIVLLDNVFLDAIGFEMSGYYPPETFETTGDKYFINGSISPNIKTRFQPVHYKPNNDAFATQGGVTASSFITRLRYNTITNATTNYTTPLGKADANALAYNVPSPGYSYKYNLGYSANCVPTAKQDQMTFCEDTKLRGG